ncbi:MAG: cob(I)yrinic acid a,c-diamide adenosyltransferase [Bacteroidetes bacterium]|nr:cob(I)yrinic acid a,c-diamide adenosyltransferase [Bacteroidota bacterium]
MKIYTKTGDKGETALFGGERVPKDAQRIEAYGSVDELNCELGVIRAAKPHPSIDRILAKIQHQLFELGADLATPIAHQSPFIPRIKRRHAVLLERTIDALEKELQPLKTFILPGGSPTAAHLHLARTVCRRAERNVVRLSRNEDIGDAVIVYLNRLSDLLFVMARYANHKDGVEEVKWVSGKRKQKTA